MSARPLLVWCIGLTGYAESCKIAKVFAIDVSPTKGVDDIVDNGGSVAFARDGNVPDARQLGPLASRNVHCPRVVVVVAAVRSSEPASISFQTIKIRYGTHTKRRLPLAAIMWPVRLGGPWLENWTLSQTCWPLPLTAFVSNCHF